MVQSNIPQVNGFPFLETAYAVEIVPDICTDGTVVYFARHPEIPGCETHGNTVEEARQNLAEVWQLTIEYLQENNLPIPFPQERVSVEWRVFVGNDSPSQPLTPFTSGSIGFLASSPAGQKEFLAKLA